MNLSKLLSKENILKIIVVAIALGFLLGGINLRGSVQEEEKEALVSYSGGGIVEATVAKYRPYLYLEDIGNYSLEELKALEYVDDVIESAEQKVVAVDDSSNVYLVYKKLEKMGIGAYTYATIILPSSFEIELKNGSTQVVSGGSIDYLTAPIVPEKTKVKMLVEGQGIGDQLTKLTTFELVVEKKEFELEVMTGDAKETVYIYEIPWEDRIGLNYSERCEYRKNELVLFSDVKEIIPEKKEYVIFVDEKSLVVEENFADKEKLIEDYGEGLEFLSSSLVCLSEQDIEFEPEIYLTYKEEIQEGALFEDSSAFELEYVLGEGVENATINVMANVVGNQVMDAEQVSAGS
ncbi:hypothetical protein KAW38_04100 [Candidatus Micrarchaeota archaeon]|nr:hypothetical protein [Candidatus Micrarchaeota archaeon]